MANRWLFAGGGMDTIRAVVGSPQAETSITTRDGTYADHSVRPAGSAGSTVAYDFIDSSSASDAAVTGETLHVRFTGAQLGTISTAANAFELWDNSDQPWLAIRGTGTANKYGLYYNSGTGGTPVWTRLGVTDAEITTGLNFVITISITLGSPHTVKWTFYNYTSELLYPIEEDMTFTQASLTAIGAVANICAAFGVLFYASEVAASVGIPLEGSHVHYLKPSAAGASSAWTGSYTDINDGDTDDGDYLTSTSAGQRSTFTYSNLQVLSGSEAVGDVFLATRVRNDGGSSPQNVKPVRRDSGGTDNVGSSFSGISTGFVTFVTRYAALSEAEINATEFGVESAA